MFKNKTEEKNYENWKISLLNTFKEAYPDVQLIFPIEGIVPIKGIDTLFKAEAKIPAPPPLPDEKEKQKIIEDLEKIAEIKARKEEEQRKARIQAEIDKLQAKLEKKS